MRLVAIALIVVPSLDLLRRVFMTPAYSDGPFYRWMTFVDGALIGAGVALRSPRATTTEYVAAVVVGALVGLVLGAGFFIADYIRWGPSRNGSNGSHGRSNGDRNGDRR